MTGDERQFHMPLEEFRRQGHAVIDWIVDYYGRIESYPVLSRAAPGDIRDGLPDQPPVRGEAFTRILDDVEDKIMPGITHWQSPNFHAFFPANTSGPAILGELLSAGLGVQGMLWATSPACTELETHVLDWLVDMLELPRAFKSDTAGGGVILDAASSATLCALLAARERASDFRGNTAGASSGLVAYCSTQTHSSMDKAVAIAGIGRDQLRKIAVDEDFALNPDALAERIREDRAAGLKPFFVCATVGTTSSYAIDPLEAIGKLCRDEDLWLHVDAAMAGTAAICPEYRYIHSGLDCAESYCFNPHKWMFTNFDCDCFFVADRESLIRTLSVVPEYLRNEASETGTVIDYRDWQIPLGRRFRALKLWFVIRYYGIEGLQHHIRRHVELTRQFEDWITGDERFELCAPARLNLLCFRHRAGEDVNRLLLERLNARGKLYLSHTVLDGRYCLRFCVGQTNTGETHIKAAWEEISSTADRIISGDPDNDADPGD
jgi:aromatic-L-amino-acid decarboxylase